MSIRAKPSATVPCGIHIGTPAMSLVRSDPQHLPGRRNRTASARSRPADQQHLLEDGQQNWIGVGKNPTSTSIRRCRLRRVTTAAPEERHADHDENLHLVGADERDTEQIAADHIGEIEQDRKDERQRQRQLDDARTRSKALSITGCLSPKPEFHAPGRRDVLLEKAYARSCGGQRR